MNIEIADVRFRMACADRPINPLTSDKTYRPFVSANCLCGANTVTIETGIVTDRFPDFSKLNLLCSTPGSWSMFLDGGEFSWVNTSPSREPFLAARFGRRPDKVTVYCRERFLTEINGRKHVENPITYPLDQFLVMYALAERDGVIVHACAVDMEDSGFIMAGRSSAGKTTVSRLMSSRGHPMLSDDRVVVRKIDNEFHAYGTPWPGEGKIAENRRVPLKALLFLRKSDHNRIEKLSPIDAFHQLMPVTSIPWFDKDTLPFSLAFCEDLVLRIPAYELHFRPDDAVVDLLEASAATL